MVDLMHVPTNNNEAPPIASAPLTSALSTKPAWPACKTMAKIAIAAFVSLSYCVTIHNLTHLNLATIGNRLVSLKWLESLAEDP